MTLVVDSPQLLAVGTALATLPVLLGTHAALRGRAGALVSAAVAHAVAWLVACRALADGLGVADWAAGGAFLLTLWLGWFQIVSVLGRGFSLQLLVEIETEPRSLPALIAGYAGGRGVDWMLEKRVRGLEHFRLAQRLAGGEGLQATARGLTLARVARIYKTMAGIGAGG
ncbi:MAG: hypothetical protein AAGN46_03655 [Acidobacteriota bacterium]